MSLAMPSPSTAARARPEIPRGLLAALDGARFERILGSRRAS